MAALAAAVALCGLGLAACGKRGDPLPPIRRTPQPVTALRVAQRGDRVEIALTAPRASTDGARLPVLEVELLRSEAAGEFASVARARRQKAAPGEALVETEPLPAPGTTLRFAARAMAKGRASTLTEIVSLTVQAPPAPPADLRARSSPAGVALAWTPPDPPPAAGFWVYRRLRSGSYSRPLGEAPTSTPSLEDATAVPGDALCYVVRSVASTDPVVESADSGEACLGVVDAAPPTAPTGVAVLLREGGIDLSWSASAEADLEEYRVYRSAQGAAPERLSVLPRRETAFRDTRSAAGVLYLYTVTAVDRAGNESPPSAPVEFGLP